MAHRGQAVPPDVVPEIRAAIEQDARPKQRKSPSTAPRRRIACLAAGHRDSPDDADEPVTTTIIGAAHLFPNFR
jgi:hypothetical protein